MGSEYTAVYYPGVTQASQAQEILVKPGEEVQADFSMPRTKTVEIAGHVVGHNGPINHAWVSLTQAGVDDSGIDRQDTTDEKGASE
jgi:hypothetical protein